MLKMPIFLKKKFGAEYLLCTQVFEWFKLLKNGQEGTKDDPNPG